MYESSDERRMAYAVGHERLRTNYAWAMTRFGLLACGLGSIATYIQTRALVAFVWWAFGAAVFGLLCTIVLVCFHHNQAYAAREYPYTWRDRHGAGS